MTKKKAARKAAYKEKNAIRKKKIYTKTGDEGKTSLYDGTRVHKTEQCFDLLGEIDELSSRIGFLRSDEDFGPQDEIISDELVVIQKTLQNINSVIATPNVAKQAKLKKVHSKHVEALERAIDRLDDELPPLHSFITPFGMAHMCRTQARKVERTMLKFHDDCREVSSSTRKYMNRLSDYFFTLSRYILEFADDVSEYTSDSESSTPSIDEHSDDQGDGGSDGGSDDGGDCCKDGCCSVSVDDTKSPITLTSPTPTSSTLSSTTPTSTSASSSMSSDSTSS